MFADQAADGLRPLDLDGLAGLVQLRCLVPRLMGPVAVVVRRVLGQDLPEVLVTVDQQVVQAFAAQRSGEPFGEGVRRR